MTDIRVMNEIAQMPRIRRKWKLLSRERKLEILRIVGGCADERCLLDAITATARPKAKAA